MTEHLSRQQLLAAGRRKTDGGSARHLQNCPECNELAGLLTAFDLAGRPLLASAPPNWISKAMALGVVDRAPGVVERVVAALAFDSWSQNLVLGTRGTVKDERRLRFVHDDVSLDLRAEHTGNSWGMIARLTAANTKISDVAIEVDGERFYPDQSGFVDWSSPQPPAVVNMLMPTHIVTTESITWNYEK